MWPIALTVISFALLCPTSTTGVASAPQKRPQDRCRESIYIAYVHVGCFRCCFRLRGSRVIHVVPHAPFASLASRQSVGFIGRTRRVSLCRFTRMARVYQVWYVLPWCVHVTPEYMITRYHVCMCRMCKCSVPRYILHKISFARVLCFILMKDIGRWLPWMLPRPTGRSSITILCTDTIYPA